MSEFLAEAQVVIRPDTTGFRALLETQLAAATAKPFTVPVVPSLGSTTAAGSLSKANLDTARSADALGASSVRAAEATAALSAQQKLAAASAGSLAFAQGEVLGATSAAGAAQATLSRSARAVTIAEAELANALRTNNFFLVEAASNSVRLARAQLAEAETATAATAAQTAHAASLAQVGRAGLAGTAGMLGLRGAVLTAGGAFIAATVGLQAFGKAVGSAISFEKELNVFAETSGATASELERVSAAARELGRDITLPGVAANDAAQTLSLLARAGLSVQDSLDAVRGTLQLATAAEIENAKAAELVANALNSFKLDGQEAARVADLLAGAANSSQGSIEDMGLALKQTSAIASGLGISVEDTVTILTQLSRAGLSASDAGTSFRQTLLRLIQDLPKVNEEVERLGLDLRDASGNIRPEVFEELGDKLKTLAPAARQLAIANLGGADAIRTLLILTRAQSGEFDAVKRSVTEAGLAQELAAARTEGLGGDVEGAKNEFAELGLTVGQVASGPLSLLARTAGEAAGAVNDLSDSISGTEGGQGFGEAFGDAINDFAGSVDRLNFAFQTSVRTGPEVADTFSTIGAVAEAAASGVDVLVDALNAAGAAIAAGQGSPQDEGLGVQQVLNRVAGFDAAEVRARISGDNNELLSVLQSEQAFLESQLDRQFVKNRPALRRRLEAALLGVVNDIEAISNSAASAKTSAAAKIAQAQSAADQKFLAALGLEQGARSNALLRAQATAGLKDDIAAQIVIRDGIKSDIAEVRKTVQDKELAAQIIAGLKTQYITAVNAIIALKKEMAADEKKARQDARAKARADRRESLALDVEIAQATGNESAEARARSAEIAFLKKQIAITRDGSLQQKRLILELRQKQKELRELKDEAKETQREGFSTFEFLQKQQGFAANLLGNLIPGFATAGLVGGSQAQAENIVSPTAALQAQAGAGRVQGPTFGQAQTEVDVLKQMLVVLKNIQSGRSHPEAASERYLSSAVMDGQGGSSGGGQAVN